MWAVDCTSGVPDLMSGGDLMESVVAGTVCLRLLVMASWWPKKKVTGCGPCADPIGECGLTETPKRKVPSNL